MSEQDGGESLSATPKGQRTIFILYVPGGAMLASLPAAILAYLRELTDTPSVHLFQASDGVSGGTIVNGGLNIPDPDDPCKPRWREQDSFQFFLEQGTNFFPEIPRRKIKMAASTAIHVARDRLLDPLEYESLQIHDINDLCDEMLRIAPALAEPVEALRAKATKRWLMRGDRLAVLKMCDDLRDNNCLLTHAANQISELVYARDTISPLGAVFRKGAIGGLNFVYESWAKNYLYDPAIPKRFFEDIFGDARMSDCLHSTYMTTFDREHSKAVHIYCRKDDLFALPSPANTGVTNAGNNKISDAVMACIPNPFIYQPYRTEDGILCTDKATVHSPIFCIKDILAHKPEDANVKLVVLGTGVYLSLNQKNRDQIEYGRRYGMAGNLIEGRELEELNAYTMSQLYEYIGQENVIEIMPRLAPHRYREREDMPSPNSFDASDDAKRRLIKTARRTMREDHDKIVGLARMLIENQYNIGRISEERLQTILRRIDAFALYTPPEDENRSVFHRLPSHMEILAQTWQDLCGVFSRAQKQKPATPRLTGPEKSGSPDCLPDMKP